MTEYEQPARIPPVRRQIVVLTPPAVAFEAFTAHIGAWWPLVSHSVHGAQSTVDFVSGVLVEDSPDGRSVWGSVVEWVPPHRFRMTWHPGVDVSEATDVCVRFDEVGDGSQTLVTLEHSNWERRATPLATRNGYVSGWLVPLGCYESYANAVEPAPTDASEVWLALSHAPGADAPADRDVYAHPRFRDHFGFVSELHDEGVLVGAGPLEGHAGHGMTVIRTTAVRTADYVRRAQEDPSVATGLLQVDISVWAVRLSA